MPIRLRPIERPDYVVLFDGTDSCPTGRYLTAQRDPVRPAPKSPYTPLVRAPLATALIEALQAEDLTLEQLTGRLREAAQPVQKTLQRLVDRQLVVVVDYYEPSPPRPGQHAKVAIYGVPR